MASLSYSPSRGVYRVFYRDGADRRSVVVCRIGPGTPRPARDPAEATFALAEWSARESVPASGIVMASEGLARHLVEYRATRRPNSALGMERVGGTALRVLGDHPLHQFPEDAAVQFVKDRLAEGVGHTTVKYEVALLSVAWGWLVEAGLAPSNPWRKRVVIPARKKEPERRSWTPAEYERLVALAPRWLADILVLGCHTGMRVGEICLLEWEWVREEGKGAIRVPPEASKNGKERRIPLHPKAKELLDSIAVVGKDGSVLRSPRGGPPVYASAVQGVRKLCKKAGLPVSGSHSMRRSFGRWAVFGQGPFEGSPVPLYVVSRWLGHSSTRMTESYLALSEQASDQWMPG